MPEDKHDACDGGEDNKLVVVDRRAGGAVERLEPDQNGHAPGALLRLALERDLPLDKIDRLMDLQARYEATEARKAYVRAMSDFKRSDCPNIIKDKTVSYKAVCYSHATLAHIVEQCIAGLARHGMHHEWSVDQSSGIRVTCRITHRDGHCEDKSLVAGPDNSGTKNAIQALGSTITYLERYTLLMALGLAPGDDDDGQAAAPQREEQPAPARQAPPATQAEAPAAGALSPRAQRAIRAWDVYLDGDAQGCLERYLGEPAAAWTEDHYAKMQSAWSATRHLERQERGAELRILIGQDHR